VLNIAVIADNDRVPSFALDAINAIEGTDQITVYSCTNTRLTRKWLRHACYYGLNLFTIRNALTQPVTLAQGNKRIARTISFASDYDGIWQKLPPEIVRLLNDGGFDVILKFGMGLLRVPEEAELGVPILSYHHGDPDYYRGRPAGFWETVEGRRVVGQIVQVIGNKLDAGRVVAFAETRVLPWSYRATLMESFRHSPLLINTAIRNAVSGRTLEKTSQGRNFRLPSNLQTAGFTLRMAMRMIRRLGYGAFIEKRWRVSTAPVDAADVEALIAGDAFPANATWNEGPVMTGFTFYADPFFTSQPQGILVEALEARTGLGRILMVQGDEHQYVASVPGHMSYPAVARIAGEEIVLPETSEWTDPMIYTATPEGLKARVKLRVQGSPRLVDATLFEHADTIYLFANIASEGSNSLRLWSAATLDDEFLPHPASPLRITPSGGRMGGAIAEVNGRLFRFGQDFTSSYGDGLFSFEITKMTPHEYQERRVGRIRFSDRKGPHTINLREGEIVFDWYFERFSPLAALRRLSARRSSSHHAAGSND